MSPHQRAKRARTALDLIEQALNLTRELRDDGVDAARALDAMYDAQTAVKDVAIALERTASSRPAP